MITIGSININDIELLSQVPENGAEWPVWPKAYDAAKSIFTALWNNSTIPINKRQPLEWNMMSTPIMKGMNGMDTKAIYLAVRYVNDIERRYVGNNRIASLFENYSSNSVIEFRESDLMTVGPLAYVLRYNDNSRMSRSPVSPGKLVSLLMGETIIREGEKYFQLLALASQQELNAWNGR